MSILLNLAIATALGVPTGKFICNIIDDVDAKNKRKLKREIKTINNTFKSCMYENKIFNEDQIIPNIINTAITPVGYKLKIDISNITTYDTILNLKSYIKASFKAKIVNIIDNNTDVEIAVIDKDIDNLNFRLLKTDPLKPAVGYSEDGYINLDLTLANGILINGNVGTGKSYLFYSIIRQLKHNNVKNIYGIQLMKKDLLKEGLEVSTTVDDAGALLDLLQNKVNNGNEEITYLFIDESSFFTNNKTLVNKLSLLLRTCRSENIRVIMNTQKVHSDFLPTAITSLMDHKLTFKVADAYSSRNVIGTDDAVNLKNREFIYFNNGNLLFGKSFNLNT